MKFNFLQGDFSAGELSTRAQGHADSEAYKAGLKLAANVAPTRTGSLASRAGLEFLLTGIDGNTLAASNLPVQHVPIQDAPFGDMVLEVSPTGIRMVDRHGIIIPWNFLPTSELLQFTAQDGAFAFGDAETRTVYLRAVLASGVRSYYLSKQTAAAFGPAAANAQNAMIAGAAFSVAAPGANPQPAGSNDIWTLSGRIAGDGISAHIVQSTPANFQDIAINPDAGGNFSINFRPNVGGADQDFYIQLKTTGVYHADNTAATVLWGLKLTKNNAKEIQDTTAVIPPPTFGGAQVLPAQDRVRAAAFWAFGDYWIAFAGGADNNYATFAMRWTFTAPMRWTFGTLPCTANSLNQIKGANAVAVFQDRLWYGVNTAIPNAKRAIRASAIGFGAAWGYAAQGGSTGSSTNASGKPILFQFIVETESTVVLAGVAAVPYKFPCLSPDAQLIVKYINSGAGTTEMKRSAFDYTAVGHTFDFETTRPSTLKLAIQSSAFLRDLLSDANFLPAHAPATLDQEAAPGGSIYFNVAVGTGIPANGFIIITRAAQATDPLDLTLSSPSGKIAWLNVLRGMVMGTTNTEKLFGDGSVLALDPATGSTFDLRDESSHGADTSLGALNINDRILFVQRGRKVVRLAGISIQTDGGLISEDAGVAGEHLTAARVRSMCYLKSPVPRVVLAFDDGTGAVMTLVGKNVAFSRLTIPTCLGGIYSVAALEGDESELWVGTESGITLRARTFESDIVTRHLVIKNANPAAPTRVTYDADNPLPPVMDSWARRPLVNTGGLQYVVGLPAAAEGQSVYLLINGQLRGPLVVAAGAVPLTGLGLDTTWVDAGGTRRAQEVYVGLLYPDHRWTSLSIQGGNPVGASQNLTSRKPQLHLRFADSYLPLVNGARFAERGGSDPTDLLGARVTGDRRATEEGFQQGAVVDVQMDLPLRMEVTAIHGGVIVNSI
jgi:hypothetical protein